MKTMSTSKLVVYAAGLLAFGALPARCRSIYSYPYPVGSYDGGEHIENAPTVELPLQTASFSAKYKYAVFLSNDGMVSSTRIPSLRHPTAPIRLRQLRERVSGVHARDLGKVRDRLHLGEGIESF